MKKIKFSCSCLEITTLFATADLVLFLMNFVLQKIKTQAAQTRDQVQQDGC